MNFFKNTFGKLIKIFQVDYMAGKMEITGELPSSKQLYSNAIKVAWPSALEAVLISLIGAIDTMMVSVLGDKAISAVGITNQPKFILLAAIFSLNVAVTAITARRKGQGDREGANSCLMQSFIISAIIALIMSSIGFIFANPILKFAGANMDYIADATAYFKIVCIGVFFQAVGMTINAAQRGVGNTKISMKTNIIANVFNVIFNYLLINGIAFFPKLGVKGAAIATTIGCIVSFFMSLKSVCYHTDFLSLDLKHKIKFDKQTLKLILSIGGSAAVEQIFMRFGFFTFAKLVASLGTLEFATHQICMNILNLSFAFGDGLSIASSALVGQSLGAKRKDMAMIYNKVLQRIAFIISTVLFFMFIFGRKLLMMAFTNDEKIISLGSVILIIIALTTHVQTSQVVIAGGLRGAGDTKFVAMVSLISVAVVRPISCYLLAITFNFGLVGAWLSLCADQSLRFICNFSRLIKGKWLDIEI